MGDGPITILVLFFGYILPICFLFVIQPQMDSRHCILLRPRLVNWTLSPYPLYQTSCDCIWRNEDRGAIVIQWVICYQVEIIQYILITIKCVLFYFCFLKVGDIYSIFLEKIPQIIDFILLKTSLTVTINYGHFQVFIKGHSLILPWGGAMSLMVAALWSASFLLSQFSFFFYFLNQERYPKHQFNWSIHVH